MRLDSNGSVNLRRLAGSESPEGKLKAVPGEIYQQSNGKFWVKESENGNTGWVQYGAGGAPVSGSGITVDGDTVNLGGDLTGSDITTITFDPTVLGIGFGDLSGKLLGFGNVLNDGKATLLNTGDNVVFNLTEQFTVTGSQASFNADKVIAESIDGSGNKYRFYTNALSGTYSVSAEIQETGGVSFNHTYGLFIFDNSGHKTANIYYAIQDVGTGAVTDISRVEANKDKVHTRHIIDGTGVLPNYNGTEAADTYSQLEFNKTAEDGQTTGTCWTLNTNGAGLWVGGVNVAAISNAGLLDATGFSVGGNAGVDFSGLVTNITIEKGIVTAAS